MTMTLKEAQQKSPWGIAKLITYKDRIKTLTFVYNDGRGERSIYKERVAGRYDLVARSQTMIGESHEGDYWEPVTKISGNV